MKIATVISNLKTYIQGLSWTSDSGTGTTSFNGVFTYPNWENTVGYPYVVILDDSGSGISIDNYGIEFTTQISIHVCVNYATIDKQDEDLQREEAMIRLRESWDYLKTKLFDITTMNTIGAEWIFEPTVNDDYDEELNLYKKVITLNVKEYISRG